MTFLDSPIKMLICTIILVALFGIGTILLAIVTNEYSLTFINKNQKYQYVIRFKLGKNELKEIVMYSNVDKHTTEKIIDHLMGDQNKILIKTNEKTTWIDLDEIKEVSMVIKELGKVGEE